MKFKEILTRGEGDWGSEAKLANAALDEANVMQALAESDDFEIVANEATNKKEFTDKITGGVDVQICRTLSRAKELEREEIRGLGGSIR
ncbi:hypothetical protein PM082_004605 [Marasmius tenuissimus]|nr:hypothetical protein PM082_004605 [Marasmius tenuissimus]